AEALMPHVPGSSASFPDIRKSATWDGSRLATTPAMPRRRRFAAWVTAAAAVLLLAAAVGVVGFAVRGVGRGGGRGGHRTGDRRGRRTYRLRTTPPRRRPRPTTRMC